MSFALNEIEATAKRATRGAGYDWGLAEDASKAVRWLCAQGLDGAGALAALLSSGFAADLSCHRPRSLGGAWRGEEALCPLATGAALSDCASQLAQAPIQMGPVAQPLLVVPFAAMAARRLKGCVTVTAEGFSAVTDGAAIRITGALSDSTADLQVAAGGVLEAPRSGQSRAEPDAAAWDTLNQFAHKTYAPATEQSRLLGAGAGLSDND